ncbi:MAG: cob(I)yrinic acid a,c-diamide adenosyltransferase, partial [Planctomycetaceae bacterium]
MKIYTKKGDEGFTSRLGVPKVRKSDRFFEVLGTIDELNANIGSCIHAAAQADNDDIQAALGVVQPELMCISSLVAAVGGDTPAGVSLDQSAVDRLERHIDASWNNLPKLTHFIQPGGCELACRLHLARTVCRRTERVLVTFVDDGQKIPEVIGRYINRLSDLLF